VGGGAGGVGWARGAGVVGGGGAHRRGRARRRGAARRRRRRATETGAGARARVWPMGLRGGPAKGNSLSFAECPRTGTRLRIFNFFSNIFAECRRYGARQRVFFYFFKKRNNRT